MTIQQWERAAGHIHEIKQIESKMDLVRKAINIVDIENIVLLDADTREACREAILAMLQRKVEAEKAKMESL